MRPCLRKGSNTAGALCDGAQQPCLIARQECDVAATASSRAAAYRFANGMPRVSCWPNAFGIADLLLKSGACGSMNRVRQHIVTRAIANTRAALAPSRLALEKLAIDWRACDKQVRCGAL